MRSKAIGLVLLLCAAMSAPAGGEGGIGTIQSLTPGLDTMAPVVSKVYIGCGVYEFTATELRNIPDPPRVPPLPSDQVDRGIASVTLLGSPSSVNAKLTLITDQSFPRDNPYFTFKFRVEPQDPSQTAYVYVYVRDWAGNLTTQELIIQPASPTVMPKTLTTEARVNKTSTVTVTITNSTDVAQTLTGIVITGSNKFAVTNGGITQPTTLAPQETKAVTVTYSPDMASEQGDAATLNVQTSCGVTPVAISGKGLLARLETEDWDAGETTPRTRICKQGGFKITNNGNAPVTITGFNTNNPNVTVTTNISAGNPAIVNAGASMNITELCYERPDAGVDAADVTVICDAEAGDAICKVTAKATTTSVDPEVLRKLNVRFDASAFRVLFDDDRAASLVDVTGTTVALSMAGERSLNTQALASGAYFLVISENPAVVVPVLVTR